MGKKVTPVAKRLEDPFQKLDGRLERIDQCLSRYEKLLTNLIAALERRGGNKGPELLGEGFSLPVTVFLGEYMEARENGELPTKESRGAKVKKFFRELSLDQRAELIRAIDTFEGFHAIREARKERKKK